MKKPESRTLAALIDELARNYPDHPAVSFEGRTVTFAESRRLAIDFAKALHADGVKPGDKVGILMGNRIEWLIVNFAIQYVGATMVALNTWYTTRELAYVLEHADVSALIATDSYIKADYVAMLGELGALADKFPLLRRVVMLGDRQIEGAIAYGDYLSRGAAVSDDAIDSRAAAVQPNDLAYLLFTSGSTAHPKGVMLQHDSLIDNMWNIGERMHLVDGDTMYFTVSLFWGMGCENMLMTCWTHATHIVLQDQFDPLDGLQLIERYRCTAITGTDNIIRAVFEHPQRDQHDLSTLTKGVAPGSPEATRKVIETWLPLACRCYGLTESYGFATVNDASDPIEKRSETEGRALPGTDLWIVSPETGERLPPGEAGEVRLRGHVMPGYYKNDQANADSFDANGFFKTSDLGVVDSEGYLYFKGRLKEMLKTSGMNVAPAEVEQVLRTHPAIAEAFVTGLPDAVRGEAVAAVIVLHKEAVLDSDGVIAHCRGELAAYKVPRHVLFTTVDKIPQTSTRKVHRLRLASLFEKR